MTTNKESMGRRIARLRKDKHLTQDQLARRLGVTAQAVSKWENDLSCPDISILPLLAKELDISVDELLDSTPKANASQNSTGEDYSNDGDDEKKNGINVHIDLQKKKWHIIVIALLMISAGVLYLLNQFQVISISPAGFWSVIWPLCVLFAGISMMDESFSYIGFGLALFGLYKFLYNIGILPTQWLLSWDIVWPFLLILLGISIFVGVFRKKRYRFSKDGRKYVSDNKVSSCNYKDGAMIVELAFCNEIYVPDRFVNRIMVEASFGNCTLDLRNCDCSDQLRLDADVNFGDLTVIIPRWMQARLDASTNKFSKTEMPSFYGDDCRTLLLISGEANFGAMKIVYGD